jgi:Ca2+-binding RTX toxin-like protein
MVEYLSGRSSYDSIQIISHGSPGSIWLGSSVLDASTLDAYAFQLSTIGNSLTENGDLLLYGCNVGAGAVGESFIEKLSEMTGADVAASDDVAGGVAVGGDWELEVVSGEVDSEMLSKNSDVAEYAHTLGVVDDYMLAKMSLVAYYDDPSHPDDKDFGRNVNALIAWNELQSDGWDVLENHQEGSFSVTAFERGDTIVLAYRGTNDAGDWLAANPAIAGFAPWDLQFSYALLYAFTMYQKYADAKEIYVTGHSLGGGLAQVVSQMFQLPGATFDPGGAKNLTTDALGLTYDLNFSVLAARFGLPAKGIGVSSDFTNYLVEGSPVSGIFGLTNDHIGKTEPLKEGELIDFIDNHYLFNDVDLIDLLGLMSMPTVYSSLLGIDYVKYSHYMGGILEFMRQKTSLDSDVYYGSYAGDTKYFDGLSNMVYGYGGSDHFSGGGGDDTIDGGAGGSDTAIYSGNFYDYSITLDKDGLVFTVTDLVAGRDGTDTLSNVEYLQFADGTKAAGEACTAVYGSYRDEYLYGNDLDNILNGNGGHDVLEGKGGNDTLDGGSGEDTAMFSGNRNEYTITQQADSSVTLTDQVSGRDGTDLAISVENFRFADGVWNADSLPGGGGGGENQLLYTDRTVKKMYPGHTSGELRNSYAFAAIRYDGSVVTWGLSGYGGDSNNVADKLDGSVDVVEVFSANAAFAALREDGSVVTWGHPGWGGGSSAVASQLDGSIDVAEVFSNDYAFAALREDGTVVTWGVNDLGGDSSAVAGQLDGSVDVVEVFSTNNAFAALRKDGSVVTWGESVSGGDSSALASQLDGSIDVVEVISNGYAFAALREDGSVVTWGNSGYGGDSSAVSSQLDGSVDVVDVFSAYSAFAALREDGSVVTWGGDGGDSSAVSSQLDGSVDVVDVFSTAYAFAALREDGLVVTWGDSGAGGNSSAVSSQLDGSVDVVEVISSGSAFAALREDGSVVTWGADYGGVNSSAVSSQLNGSVDVVEVFSTNAAFAALREDGSVVTWGDSGAGGNSSAVSSQLDGSEDVVKVFSTNWAFAALREDGSVVTWGKIDGGGNSSAVQDELHDVISISDIYSCSSVGPIFEGTDGADDLQGSYSSDILWGNGGNDMLFAKGGNDLAFGGNGNDLFIGGSGEGDDTYEGGEGDDTVEYPSALAGITVDLSEGTAYSIDGNDAAGIGIDTLMNIEHIIAGNYDDLLIGNDGANSIEGGAGNDTLFGGEGADTLDGGEGSDTADYSDKSLSVVMVLNGSADAVVTVGGVAEDTIRNIENVIGGDGNDVFTGDSADNNLLGGLGADTLDGGAGSDTADYSDKLLAVEVMLHGSSDTSVTVDGLAEDTIRNIENLLGGSGADLFVGDAADNILSGNAGNDSLEGGAGNDTIIGGFDDDTVLFSGNLEEYQIGYDQSTGFYIVTDMVADRDGIDQVTSVEHFQFADGRHDTVDLLDIDPPYLMEVSPSGYANDVAVDSPIVLTFTETIHAGTGSIRLLVEGEPVLAIDITDSAQVSIDGTTLTIDPSTDLALNTQYELQVDAGALLDDAGNAFTGLDGYEFKTASGDRILAGSVSFWEDGTAIPGVWGLLRKDGLLERVSDSGEDGTYACQGLAEGDYTIQLIKGSDENDTEAVEVNDAFAALNLVLGDGKSSSYQYLAADIDRDGKVGFRDTLGILKMALGRDDAPEPEWAIVPADTENEPRDSSNVNWPEENIAVTLDQDTQIDLVGVLIGDVDGSWGSGK